MTPEELRETSQTYKENMRTWRFNQHAYESFMSLIHKEGVLKYDADKREPMDIEYREMAAWGADLSGWTVDTMADFVGTVPFNEDFSAIINNWDFEMFLDDCDIDGTDWNVFWDSARRAAYATGMQGLLIDKGSTTGSLDTDKSEGVYPYIVSYSPLSVLDFKYSRKENSNRPYLSYLKLIESDETYKIWTDEEWRQL